MNRIKVIQIGIGHDHASNILDSLLRLDDVFEVAALALPESEKTDFADRLQRYDKLPVMSVDEALAIENLDAAVIETEEVNLTKYAHTAAKNGLPVHMDKPGGIDLTAFEELIKTVKTNKTPFHLGYMYRYNRAINEAIAKAKSGELGEVYCVEAHMDCFHSPEKRQWLAQFPGGMLFFLGCHLIDLVLRIMGEPDEVIPMSAPTGADNVTAEDYGMVLFKYKSGISFAKSCATEPGGFARRQLVICGSEGTAELKPLEAYDERYDVYTGVRYTSAVEAVNWAYTSPVVNSKAENRYDGMMRGFAELVRGERQNPFDYDYELKLYKLILRCCGSL